MGADAKDNARANHRVGPIGGTANVGTTSKVFRGLAAITLTGATQVVDLQTWFGENLGNYFVRMICDQDFYYYWSNLAADTVVIAAVGTTTAATGAPNSITGAATYGDLWKANTRDEEIPGGRYLIIISAAAATLRISVANARTQLLQGVLV